MAESYTSKVISSGTTWTLSAGDISYWASVYGVMSAYGTAYDTLVASGSLAVSSGGLSVRTTVLSGAYEEVYADAVASGTVVSGGEQRVKVRAKAYDTVLSGGSQWVDLNAKAYRTVVSSGGVQRLTSSSYASDTTVYSGGSQNIDTNASAAHTVVSRGGLQYVDNAGTASGTVVSSGGSMILAAYATASNTTVSSGGSMIVSMGSIAYGTTVSYGGRQELYGRKGTYSTFYGTEIGGTIAGIQHVHDLGVATETRIESGGRQHVSSGGSAADTKIGSDGIQYVSNGGTATNADIFSGGVQNVLYGGSAARTKIHDAVQNVLYGGYAEDTYIGRDGLMQVEMGGFLYNVSVAGKLVLNEGASAGGYIWLEGEMEEMEVNGGVTFEEGTQIALDLTKRSPSGGYMVTGLSELPDNVVWTLAYETDDLGTYKLIEDLLGAENFSLWIYDDAELNVNSSYHDGVDGLWYALSTEDGLCLTVAAEDPLYAAPDPITINVSDANLNTPVSIELPKGVTVTNEQLLRGEDVCFGDPGSFSLKDRTLTFTQQIGYRHAAGEDSASVTFQIGVTNKFGNATKQDVTVTIADSTPTISVTAPSASVPSGTAKSGMWAYSFGADQPSSSKTTVTIGSKTLDVRTSTNSVAVAGTYGTLTVKADKTYSYTANPDAAGTDSFTFKITDADGDSKTATLKVTAVDKTAPTITKITGVASAIGATLQFSEKMNATSLKSALKATFTGTGATAAPTAVKETNAASHIYSATFAATDYVGAYKLTLGTGAKDLAGNAIAMVKTVNANMTVTGKTIASGAYQKVYAGGAASASKVSGQQLVYNGGKVVNGVINKGGKLVLYSGGTATGATIAASATATAASGATITGAKVAGTLTATGAVKTATIQKGGKLYLKGGAVATGNTIASGATAVVSSGATAATFSGGSLAGTLTVNSTGIVKAAAVKAGGKLTLKTGAKSTRVKIAGTSAAAGTMTVAGTATTTTVQAYGALTVNGGTATTVSVAKNGSLTLTKGTVKALTLAAGGKAQLNGGSLTGTTTLNGGVTTVAAAGVKVAKITAKTSAVVSYDISKQKAGGTTAMLTESTKQALNTGYRIVTAKAQQMGSYRLSSKLTVASGKAFAIYQGTTKLGTAKKLNGVSYTVSQASNVVSLKLAVAAGKMLKGTAGAETLTGTAHSDIFWGGKGNDVITGTNGRDVAVYDSTAWGKDTIKATSGTMTIVLAGIAKSKVTETTSGTTKTFTLTGTSQKITVQGWNAATHKILYNQTLSAFNTYVKAASPTTAQTTAARNEVWQKAGLASA